MVNEIKYFNKLNSHLGENLGDFGRKKTVKVVHLEDGFLVQPETEFEAGYLEGLHGELIAYKKTGLSPADFVGIKIKVDKPAEPNYLNAVPA